ncbi:MAG TPA: hypothetical protein VFP43_01985 [Mesorhizobium sp.]|nr:hypothetical protein [Mesorhizobium sp.]
MINRKTAKALGLTVHCRCSVSQAR